ncbi:MAG: UDP-glucose 6-dehydrogenase [Halobacteriovorax sp.]|nr:UDP-glucose 6-dehydrogenase [Halobacteriovorax sp.]|tara:strand:- start:49975 stop:51300 length:1326 start_codon:yes stop_codon:yes gene_type:complete
MKVVMIGTGYVGLVSGTCFAEIGHDVTCIDIDEAKIAILEKGESPIFEPGLSDLLKRNISSKRLNFSLKYDAVAESDAVFLAVGTPPGADGQADLKYLYAAAESVAEKLPDGGIVVIKSTVPVGTSTKLREFISTKTNKTFHLVNNPEFLKEGSAVEDFMRPDRVVIGHQSEVAAKAMEELYSPLVRQGNPIYMMSNLSAEMTKYAANCFLATKISFINEIAGLCDLAGADINEVRKGISSDIRIGKHFFYPGPGYGGSCFPKDVQALVHTAKELGTDLKIVQATEEVNNSQKTYMYKKINNHFNGDLKGKTFAFWGVAFKANTDDVREAPAIYMSKALVQAGATVRFYDPEASENFSKLMEAYPVTEGKLELVKDMYECINGCDGLVTMTEWREFQAPDFKKIKAALKTPVIFDGRNLYQTEKVLSEGFEYYAIGKHISK